MAKPEVWSMEEGLKRFVEAGNTVIGDLEYSPRRTRFTFSGTGNVLKVGVNVSLMEGEIILMDGSNITIDNGTLLRGTIRADSRSTIRIGKQVRMHREVRIHASERRTIRIGSGCLFSNVVIRSSDLHSVVELETGNRTNFAKDINIGPRVWLAEEVNVYKGAKIGAGSIIAARSTVWGEIPENCLAAGTPAKIIRTDVTWDRRLLKKRKPAKSPTSDGKIGD